MNKKKLLSLGGALLLGTYFLFAQKQPVDYVNPLMGTDSKISLSNGNTYPAIALPWGMNFWMPQTGIMGDGWAYTYASDKIRRNTKGYVHQRKQDRIVNVDRFSYNGLCGDKAVHSLEQRFHRRLKIIFFFCHFSASLY